MAPAPSAENGLETLTWCVKMIRWEIMNSDLDLSYDYGHMVHTFLEGTANPETDEIQVTQTLGLNEIEGQLTHKGSTYQVKTNFKNLAEKHQIERDLKVYFKLNFYDLLSQVLEPKNPYGTLVGIRPVKLVHEMMGLNRSDDEISTYLKEVYRVTEEKIELMLGIAKLERPILEEQADKNISLYICIPFCRTRCLYCSFPANSVSQKGHLMDRYVAQLTHEIVEMAKDIKSRELTVDCIYIGGGTPTALTAGQLEKLLTCVAENFDRNQVIEYTVEAGRPDTLDDEKLALMSRFKVDRICINPQTMVDHTLVEIGRDHEAQAVKDLFEKSRSYGFKHINMDLIAGLGSETESDMDYTIDEILKMRPENVTVHTLAVKRASKLNEIKGEVALQSASTVSNMVGIATEKLLQAGYEPYYMYRQKQMIGNLENIGFALPNEVCIYNVRTMEEQHSILALGAGAISKIYFKEENRLERFSNSKGLEDYLSRTDELIQRKKEWLTSRYDFSIIK